MFPEINPSDGDFNRLNRATQVNCQLGTATATANGHTLACWPLPPGEGDKIITECLKCGMKAIASVCDPGDPQAKWQTCWGDAIHSKCPKKTEPYAFKLNSLSKEDGQKAFDDLGHKYDAEKGVNIITLPFNEYASSISCHKCGMKKNTFRLNNLENEEYRSSGDAIHLKCPNSDTEAENKQANDKCKDDNPPRYLILKSGRSLEGISRLVENDIRAFGNRPAGPGNVDGLCLVRADIAPDETLHLYSSCHHGWVRFRNHNYVAMGKTHQQ